MEILQILALVIPLGGYIFKYYRLLPHAVGHDVYTVTDKDGDGFWETKLYWQSDMVDKILPLEFGEQL